MRDVQCTAKHLWRIRIRHANNQQCLYWDKFLRSKQIGGVTTGIVTFSYWCDTWDWMLKYLFCGLQVFLFSSTFIFLHTHTRSQPLNLCSCAPQSQLAMSGIKNFKKRFSLSHWSQKEEQKKERQKQMFMRSTARRNTSSLGWIQSEQRSIKGCSVWMSENTFDTLFLQWSDCVPGKKKPLYVHMTKQYSIADHIWPWNLPALQSCIHVSALRLQHVHLAFIYLSGLKSALSAPYTSQIKVSKIHRIWGAGRKKGNCK